MNLSKNLPVNKELYYGAYERIYRYFINPLYKYFIILLKESTDIRLILTIVQVKG